MFVQICKTAAKQREVIQYLHFEGVSVVRISVVVKPFKGFLQKLCNKEQGRCMIIHATILWH